MRKDFAQSSNLMTSDGVVANRTAILSGVSVITDGVNAANVTLYDSASAATGLILDRIKITGASQGFTRSFSRPLVATNGIFANLAGGANAVVHFAYMDD